MVPIKTTIQASGSTAVVSEQALGILHGVHAICDPASLRFALTQHEGCVHPSPHMLRPVRECASCSCLICHFQGLCRVIASFAHHDVRQT